MLETCQYNGVQSKGHLISIFCFWAYQYVVQVWIRAIGGQRGNSQHWTDNFYWLHWWISWTIPWILNVRLHFKPCWRNFKENKINLKIKNKTWFFICITLLGWAVTFMVCSLSNWKLCVSPPQHCCSDYNHHCMCQVYLEAQIPLKNQLRNMTAWKHTMDHKRFTFLLLFLVFQPHWISGGDVICSLEDYVLTGIEFGDCQSEAMKSYGSDDDKDRNPCAELKNVVNNCARLVSVRTCISFKLSKVIQKYFTEMLQRTWLAKRKTSLFGPTGAPVPKP